MTRNEKKEKIERMATDFVNFDNPEGKSFAIMLMSAYAEALRLGKKRSAESTRMRLLHREENADGRKKYQTTL